MKLISTTFLTLAILTSALSQTTTFYKDEYLTKVVDERKGKFKKVETENEGGVISIKVYALRENILLRESNYKDANPCGIWKTFDSQGALMIERDFSSVRYTKEGPPDVFDNVIPEDNTDNYTIAAFYNGENDMFKFIGTEIRYPMESRESGSSGIVYIQFMVDEEGNTTPYSIVRGVDPYIDYEAWRLINKMPPWKPATKNGEPIKSYSTLPFRFVLR